MILDKIVDKKKIRLKQQMENISYDSMKNKALSIERTPIDFYSSLKKYDDISIIAEIKKASPSKGLIRENFDHILIANEYLKSDVQAMSILTEQDFFLGEPHFLKDISEFSDIPLLRKDFIIHPYQIYEAYLIGASSILLIAALLCDDKLREYYKLARNLGLYCLTEVHDEEELKRVMDIGVDIIGINNRNLYNFEEDIHTTEKLIKYIDRDVVIVSESSIKTSNDIKYLSSLGVDAVLIGETFMRSDNIIGAVNSIRGK